MKKKQLKYLCIFDATIFILGGTSIVGLMFVNSIHDPLATTFGMLLFLLGLIFICLFIKISQTKTSSKPIIEDSALSKTMHIEKNILTHMKSATVASEEPKPLKEVTIEKKKDFKKINKIITISLLVCTVLVCIGAIVAIFYVF